MTTIGFVGLGAMGGRIADRLLASGHVVYATNRTRAKAEQLIEHGLIWCDTPREVAQQAEVVFTMVTDTAALEAVTAGPDGLLAGLRPASVYVDMSTTSPDASRALADRVQALGAVMLDAPVSGSVPAAEDGSLTIMVGGHRAAFERVEPILRELGRTVTHVGANGHALTIKLAINISLAVQMIAFSEGVLLAERSGVDAALAIEVMRSSAIGSPMLQMRSGLLLDRPDEAWFDVELMLKDVTLALEQGRSLHSPLPGAELASELLTTATALGYGNQDIAAVFDVLVKLGDQDRAAA